MNDNPKYKLDTTEQYESDSFYSAGIARAHKSINGPKRWHSHAIQFHANTAEKAEAERDRFFELIKDDVCDSSDS